MSEKFNIEVDRKFIDNLFGLADIQSPQEVTLSELEDVIFKIKSKISKLAISDVKSSVKPSNEFLMGDVKKDAAIRPKTVLVVDDLGIITYQLEILFKKMGFEVVKSNEVYDAIDKFKSQDFGYTVIDLFIPTEREGFILLDEIKKISLLCKLNTKILVMTASKKTEYRTKCLNRGANYFIEKAQGWQKEIMDACL